MGTSSYLRPHSPETEPELNSRFDGALENLSPGKQEEVVERAAIMEYDGGQPRDGSERYALGRVLKGPRKK